MSDMYMQWLREQRRRKRVERREKWRSKIFDEDPKTARGNLLCLAICMFTAAVLVTLYLLFG